jgi:predicted transcriptional regulator
MTKKNQSDLHRLSQREQQILSSVLKRKRASTHDVLEDIPDSPSYSSVRKIMEIMVKKGLLRFRREGLKYVYEPVMEISDAKILSLTRLIQLLFHNSPVDAVATMFASEELKMSLDDLNQIKQMIAKKAAETEKKETKA